MFHKMKVSGFFNRIRLLFFNFYSLFFCLKYLPFRQAIKIPILIHPSVKVKIENKHSIILTGRIWRSICTIGFDATLGRSNFKSMLYVGNGGHLKIEGFTVISKGTRIIIDGGVMTIGSHFFCNGDCWFNCTTSIVIGSNNMYGWGITFNTTDGHHIYVDGNVKPMEADIRIGNHVWIASYTHISKGAKVASDCVVAQCSLVNKSFDKEHCLIGGMPARVLKENIDWTAK